MLFGGFEQSGEEPLDTILPPETMDLTANLRLSGFETVVISLCSLNHSDQIGFPGFFGRNSFILCNFSDLFHFHRFSPSKCLASWKLGDLKEKALFHLNLQEFLQESLQEKRCEIGRNITRNRYHDRFDLSIYGLHPDSEGESCLGRVLEPFLRIFPVISRGSEF